MVLHSLFKGLVLRCSVWLAMAAGGRVLLDAGHTPAAPGAHAPDGRLEHDYNRRLTLAVAYELTARAVPVTTVATDGREIALAVRSGVAPDAVLFVSIHHDSIPQAWIDAGRRGEFAGYSLFVSRYNPHPDASLACAGALGERLLAAGEHPSRYHATPIAGENRPLLDSRLGIHRFDELVVLRTARVPAVLIEAGVIANPAEADRLSEPETIGRLAGAIAAGLVDCLAAPAFPVVPAP